MFLVYPSHLRLGEKSLSDGLTLTAEDHNYSWGPAQAFPDFNPTTYKLKPETSIIVLNTNCTWRDNQQHLNADPPILDVQSMITHEAGHIHGLAHPYPGSYDHDATGPTMAGRDNEHFDNTLDCRSLETEDVYGTQFLQLRVPTLYSNLQTALNKAVEIGVGYVYIVSDYTISNNITVPSGVDLYVEPDVTVEFDGNYKIRPYSLN